MDAFAVVESLRKFHLPTDDAREWAFFSELRVGTGYKMIRTGFNPEQRIDAWAINLFPSKKHLRVAYEVKISRADFKHELVNPEKRKTALRLSNQFYFAAPVGLVSVEEIPEECGLVEVKENGRLKWTKKAPICETDVPTWNFLCSIARRATNAETNLLNQKRPQVEMEI